VQQAVGAANGYGDLVAGPELRRSASANRLEQGCNLDVGDFYDSGTDSILFRNNSTGDTWLEANQQRCLCRLAPGRRLQYELHRKDVIQSRCAVA
jgi:hypothetical protein